MLLLYFDIEWEKIGNKKPHGEAGGGVRLDLLLQVGVRIPSPKAREILDSQKSVIRSS